MNIIVLKRIGLCAALIVSLCACGGTADLGEQEASTEDELTTPGERPMSLTFESPSGCLDGASATTLGFLIPHACDGSASQEWRAHPTGELQNVSTGSCLLWESFSIGNPPGQIVSGVVLGNCQTGAAGTWVPSPAGELRSSANCLSAQSGGIASDVCDGSAAQHWTPHFAADNSLAAQYGFGNMRRAFGHVSQSIPLVRVYVNYLDAIPLAHSVRYYEDLIFGTGEPRLNGYFAEASSGMFHWEDAGRFGPYNFRSNGAGCDTSPVLEDILRTNLTRRIDLAKYDTDRDGVVRHNELQFMIIGNCGGRIAGAARPVGCLLDVDSRPSHLQVCPGIVVEVEDQVQFASFAHESMHALGAIDIYPWGNETSSLMAATVYSWRGPDATFTFMLDAWHRFQLGWNRPTIVPVAAGQPSQGTLVLDGDKNFGTSLILGTPANYYFFEKRQRTGYDADVGDEGITIWQIDAAPQLVAIRDPLTGALGSGPYLKPAHGVINLPGEGGRTIAVWATGTPGGNLSLSWRWRQLMNLNVVENSHTSVTNNITVYATDQITGDQVLGEVRVGGVLVGMTNQPFDYNVLLELVCNFGNCTVGPRLQQFEVTAAGYDSASFSRR